MPHEVIMPALGMAQDTGLIVAWHKAPGEKVSTGDVLFEVETDKATMEVEAAADGFLNGVRFAEGAEVPVGDVIAVIGETAEAEAEDAPPPPAPPEAATEPAKVEGHEVIMPALGMAQDTGLIVAWHKAPGDPVASADILFEVETDKSTVEVEAGRDGFIAAIYALEGEEAPVGQPIAVISTEKPANPVQTSRADAPAAPSANAATQKPAKPAQASEPPKAEPAAARAAPAAADPGVRILASPKARRLAAEQGLDLSRLAEAGVPQPYHVADLETLRRLPAATPASTTAPSAAPLHIAARVSAAAFDAFLAWAAEETAPSPGAVWAAFAAASLRAADRRDRVTVRVETPAPVPGTSLLADPDHAPLGAAGEADGAPDLILRDLTASRITAAALGAAEAPVLTIARDGTDLALSLDFTPGHLAPEAAIHLIDGVAARAKEPLRHLL